ncbi:hypothetical protein [Azospirillum sp. B4]|uniref:hypothetical protein n=1 Tax=Azospirillum sp. B4 TaxID=95605 RepID=UPI00034A2690|nr:hypothetical protein [Azospirillum sp. B4]
MIIRLFKNLFRRRAGKPEGLWLPQPPAGYGVLWVDQSRLVESIGHLDQAGIKVVIPIPCAKPPVLQRYGNQEVADLLRNELRFKAVFGPSGEVRHLPR